ncbi:hypothetical protein BOX15_Mlig011399g2, partial [Macrostomum lignano]
VPAMMTEADEPTETTGLLVNSSQPSMLDSGQPAVPTQTSESGSGWLLSGFIVINAALGAGLLNFPQACHLAGGVGSTLTVQFVLLSFIVGSLVLLAFVSDRSHAATYQEAVASLLGRAGRLASAACIAVYCFGTCITFVIIIGDQWEQISSQFLSPTTRSQPYASKRLVMSVSSLVLILPLCFTKRIDFLKYASAAGVLGVLYMCVMVVVKYFIGGSSSTSVRTRPHSLVDVFNVVPTICFGYQCHVSVVPVYSCMRRRCLPQFARTVSFAMLICFLAYSATAVFGYWSFGAAVQSDILRNYDATPDVLIGMCLLAFKICTTYPILLFCGRAALDSVALPLLRLDRTEFAAPSESGDSASQSSGSASPCCWPCSSPTLVTSSACWAVSPRSSSSYFRPVSVQDRPGRCQLVEAAGRGRLPSARLLHLRRDDRPVHLQPHLSNPKVRKKTSILQSFYILFNHTDDRFYSLFYRCLMLRWGAV